MSILAKSFDSLAWSLHSIQEINKSILLSNGILLGDGSVSRDSSLRALERDVFIDCRIYWCGYRQRIMD